MKRPDNDLRGAHIKPLQNRRRIKTVLTELAVPLSATLKNFLKPLRAIKISRSLHDDLLIHGLLLCMRVLIHAAMATA